MNLKQLAALIFKKKFRVPREAPFYDVFKSHRNAVLQYYLNRLHLDKLTFKVPAAIVDGIVPAPKPRLLRYSCEPFLKEVLLPTMQKIYSNPPTGQPSSASAGLNSTTAKKPHTSAPTISGASAGLTSTATSPTKKVLPPSLTSYNVTRIEVKTRLKK